VASQAIADIGWKLLSQPGFVAFDIDKIVEEPKPRDFQAGMVSCLGEHEKEVAAWVDVLGEEIGFEKSTEDGATVWGRPFVEGGTEGVKMGVVAGCLIVAVNDRMWDELKTKTDGSGKAPAWLTNKTDKMPMRSGEACS